MRAFFTPDIIEGADGHIVTGEDFTHFTKVLRGRIGHDVILMNGDGLCAHGQISKLEKKSLEVKINQFEKVERKVHSELILGIPKKDYLSDILKMVTEIGVAHIHLFVSDNTPWRFSYSDRFDKILKAGALQSNNPFLPKVSLYNGLEDFFNQNIDYTVQAFMTEASVKSDSAPVRPSQNVLIGPEGGFSSQEVELLTNSPQVIIKKLPNPIMRSVTAAVFALGHIQSP